MKTNTTLNLSKEIEKISKKYPKQELTLCKGLKQPFNNTNSGSRKIMQGIQMEQSTQLLNAEVPIISTGYETELGEHSSNFIKADRDYVVVGKINKFSKFPNHHYWLILFDKKNNYLDCIERVSYKHVSEFYGYLYNNSYLDSLDIDSPVLKGSVVKKPISFDEYDNKTDGINLTTMYIASEYVKEDPIVISESAAKRFECPLIDDVEIRINDNDILLNLYGERNQYKTFPDIGENIKRSVLCALRRELKDEEALFSQSWDRLKEIMMNDKKFIVDDGTVIDIDVYCNNPEKLETSMYNSQIKQYYDETIRFSKELVSIVKPYIVTTDGEPTGVTMSYDLQKKFYTSEKVANGVEYIYDKVFSNIIMHIYVLHVKPLHKGDKITDRYGGKGCISAVLPDNMMPHYLKNGQWKPVDVLYSMCTCVNRLNDGQLFETSITFIGWQLVQYILDNKLSYDQAFALIHKYISLLSPDQADQLAKLYKFSYGTPDYRTDEPSPAEGEMSDNQFNRDIFIEDILHSGNIMLSMEPISSNISIDKVREVYHAFPFLDKYCTICVPQKDSNGNYRMVKARRKVVIGYKYIFRLKQLAEEKFSAVSLASTNIRNENSKSRMSKTHNARFPSTPVRVFGEMESSTITAHLGIDYYLPEFLITNASPQARRRHQELLTGNPFEFNIDVTDDATSQSADIAQAYLKTLGAKFRFIKLKKFKKRACMIVPATIVPRPRKNVINIIPEELMKDNKNDPFFKDYISGKLDFKKSSLIYDYIKEQTKYAKELRKPGKKVVAKIVPGIDEYNKEKAEYKRLKKELRIDQ